MSGRQLLMLLALAAIWGSSFLFIKVAVRGLDSSLVVVLRSVFAVATLLPILLLRIGPSEALGYVRRNRAPLALMGFFAATVPFVLVTTAERWVGSGLTGVLNATSPLWTALLVWRLSRSERVTRLGLAGVAVGFAGVAVLVGADPNTGTMAIVGSILIVVSTLSFAAASLFGASRLPHVPPLVTATVGTLTATVVMLPVGLARLPSHMPDWKVWGSTIALGAGGSGIAYLLFYRLLAEAGASRSILVAYLVPPIALLYGAGFLDEPITASALVGLALILVGVALGTGQDAWVARVAAKAAGRARTRADAALPGEDPPSP